MRISSSGKGRGVNFLLVVLSVVLVLGGTEVALSLFHPTEYLQVPERNSDDLFREILHRSSEIPGLSFELAPNRQRKFENVWIRTNNFGMRDSEPSPIDDESVSRVVVLGDPIW